MPALARLVARFRRDERGAFAVIFGLMAIVLIAMGGAVVDYVSLEQTRGRAQVALDAAALALQPQIYDEDLDDADLLAMAEALVIERIADDRVQVDVDQITVDRVQGALLLGGRFTIPTIFVQLVGVDEMSARYTSEAVRGSLDIEISLALDVTGSMAGQRIIDLQDAVDELIDAVVQDEQEPNYSKMALVPYAQAVNVGTYADAIRGPIRNYKSISSIAWSTGNWKTVTNATRTNPVVITSNGHGFSNGDWVYIRELNWGWHQLNDRAFQITDRTNNTFKLVGVNGTAYNNFSSNGQVIKCRVADCNVVVTSNAHGYSNGDPLYVTNVGGMTSLNNTVFDASSVTTNTLVLLNSTAAGNSYSSHTNNTGRLHCTWQTATEGCTYYRYANPWGTYRIFPSTTCVTERATNGTNDVAPSTTYAGRNYPPSGNGCIANTIVPLTDDKDALHDAVDDFVAAGSTAGQLGILWSWYMLSPNFGYLWPADSQPAPYDTLNLLKAAVIMTDGEFNTVHCNGAIAQNSGAGSGSTWDYNGCNAHNGDAYTQARAYCDAMKDANIVVFTVGFGIVEGSAAAEVLSYCADSAANYFLAEDGDDLSDAFEQIARNISQLRLRQ